MRASIENLALRSYMLAFKGVVKLLPFRWPQCYRGEESIAHLVEDMASRAPVKVALLTDDPLYRLGLHQAVLQSLQEKGLQVAVYTDIQADPDIECIDRGKAWAREQNIDCILALGGGSVIDAAKLIGAALKSAKPARKLAGLFKVRQGMLPLYVIPTTAGTGSESTIAAVLSDRQSQRKLAVMDLRLMPTAVALAPQMTLTLPAHITAATGMDALTHAIEAYLSRNALQRTDDKALHAASLINQWLPKAVAQGQHVEAREHMAYAAMLAGQAFTQAGVGYVHALAHAIGARYHVPHGLANAILLPYVLEFSRPHCSQRMAHIATAMGLTVTSTAQGAGALIERIQYFNQRFSILPYMVELQAKDIPAIVADARQEARFTYAVPRYMSQAEGEALLYQLLPPQEARD